MSKKELLLRTLRELQASTHPDADERQDQAEQVFNLIKASRSALAQGDGLSWDEVIDLVEEVYQAKLTHFRPRKCECGSPMNTEGHCDNPECRNSVWFVDYDKIQFPKEASK